MTLDNFRQYRGLQEFEVSILPDLNVTLFHGQNGAGKTGMFSALNWCLFGEGLEDIGDVFNRGALFDLPEGGRGSYAVSIKFRHKSHTYLAQRRQPVRRAGLRAVDDGPPSFTLMRLKATGEVTPVQFDLGFMNSVLPRNVRQYFFFDGEKMDDLTRAGNSEVKDAIRNVMRLPALERAETRFTEIARDLRGEIKRSASPESQRLADEEDRLRTEKTQLGAVRAKVRDELTLARTQIETLEAQLRSMEGARQLQEQRDRLLVDWKTTEGQDDKKTVELRKALMGAYTPWVRAATVDALAILDEKRERGEMPPGIREQFLQDLIERLECVCGRSFHEHDEVHARLASIMERSHATQQLEVEYTRLSGELRTLPQRVVTQRQLIDTLARDREDLRLRKTQIESELDNINRQLHTSSAGDIAALEKQRTTLTESRDRLLVQDQVNLMRLEEIDRELDALQGKKAAAEAQERQALLLTRTAALAQRLADAVTSVKHAYFETIRHDIERVTQDVFRKLAWKQEHFENVRIDQDFRLEVIDRYGVPTRKELSAGERQILSLAFICAMVQVSGEEAPLVMDTPFGRLSGDHLRAVASNLPALAPQLILFVTDREWDDASRAGLEPHTGKQYRLHFHRENSFTRVEELSPA
ncbi:AAA family ATPase [Deinococcus yavapaiensis]|uniref:AAA family ATPase n=1 Tax=Deinococcus yavapaiensis TaxID=309889 RepID=UPI0014735955|nr:AAA family ATPase [Deinococcus yavapaiensis]